MNNNTSYTIEEVAQLLRVSKLTVYDLIKKEKLPAYRVGRQMRVDHDDLERYKNGSKTAQAKEFQQPMEESAGTSPIVISGQDMILDILGKSIEQEMQEVPHRVYNGSLNSLIAMYNGQCDIVSLHLYDGETNTYNLPYVKRILVNHSFVLINLVCRNAGIYVQKGNPKQIQSWEDLHNQNIKWVNREKGSGARVLLDEQLRKQGIPTSEIQGYHQELTSHFSVASAVANGQADAAVGIENVAKMVNVDFIPLIEERYDLVVLKSPKNDSLVDSIIQITQSEAFKNQVSQIHGYDIRLTGTVFYES
ncbi:helix-turn-helix transcriptional regulator [Bacillus massiliigorillae]|uniref:helix-turn-helix transcriptional regulator n=1 Tax=Bacillus massiliigorillae TaxID=1243664 RepID=UPI00039B3068|nr:helix-turn-helix transcriptional regulator [Bacillus massiliigorillae]